MEIEYRSHSDQRRSWMSLALGLDTCWGEVVEIPLKRSIVLPFEDISPFNTDSFVETVLAALVFRYTGINNIYIGTVADERLCTKNFRFTGTDSLDSLIASNNYDLRADADVHAAICRDPSDARPLDDELTLILREEPNSDLAIDFVFRPGSCDVASADRFVGHFVRFSQEMALDSSAAVVSLNILTAPEITLMLTEWNRTSALVTEHNSIHDAFDAQVQRGRDAIAVIDNGRYWSYGEISDRANALARHLRKLGVTRDVRAGVCSGRSVDFLIGILGILKAGGAYVPLDPDYPRERVTQMVHDSDCKVLISSERIVRERRWLTEIMDPVLLLDALILSPESAYGGYSTAALVSDVAEEDLCYVIYTSGSTGEPKPIALCHRGVLNNLADLNMRFNIGRGDSALALSSTSFDMSVYEFLGIVVAGGTVVIAGSANSYEPAAWVTLLRKHQVTIWNSAPALLDLLLDFLESTHDSGELSIRLCMTGGDWVPGTMPLRFRRFAPGLRFVVVGGSTEVSVSSTFYESSESSGPVGAYLPLGQPLANQRAYVLNSEMKPVPIGLAGELYLAGRGLARGYLGRPEETAQRFVEWSPFEGRRERLFRTGDVVRFQPNGVIEMLGRTDFQVKLGGRRIELGEIEAILSRHPDVKHAVVTAAKTRAGGKSLVGYVIPSRPLQQLDSLFAALSDALPSFMVPSVIELVESFPLTPNGKVDRKALSMLDRYESATPRQYSDNPWEMIVVSAWQDVLGIDISIVDDFFDGGGDSISAIKSLSRIDCRLKLADVYKYPTAAELSEYLLSTYGSPASA